MAQTRLATREQVAQAQRDLADARATERSLRTVGANAAQQTLRAPKDAIVTAVLINAGDRSAADTAALSLAAVDGLIVRLGVEPEAAREIVAGTKVKLVSVFDSDRVIEAAAKRVHAMLNPTTRLVDVIVPIAAEDAATLTLGSQMRGSISLGAIDALVVPKSALLRDESGDYVFTVVVDRAHRVDVEVLLDRQSDAAIRGKIAAGDAVVVAGGYQLSDGTRVTSDHGAR
jgi:RND family efflux transporter MFP subunit